MEYKNRLNDFFLSRFSAVAWWGLAVLAWAVSRGTQVWLDGFYARSKFPVPFYVGQTTFDAAELKGYYAHMIGEGTLQIYLQTQLVDFVFMLTSFAFLVVLSGACLRTLPQSLRGTWLFSLAGSLLWIVPLAPVFDALENLTSFAMLADPQGFADWLVYPYSSFALIKFILFGLGYLWAAMSLLIFAGHGVRTGFRRLLCKEAAA